MDCHLVVGRVRGDKPRLSALVTHKYKLKTLSQRSFLLINYYLKQKKLASTYSCCNIATRKDAASRDLFSVIVALFSDLTGPAQLHPQCLMSG